MQKQKFSLVDFLLVRSRWRHFVRGFALATIVGVTLQIIIIHRSHLPKLFFRGETLEDLLKRGLLNLTENSKTILLYNTYFK